MVATHLPGNLYGSFPKKAQDLFAVVAAIPRGKVASYGIAGQLAGMHARQVGYWLHKNPSGSAVPCHRVVRSNGELAGGYVFGGPDSQRKMLEKEGVSFKEVHGRSRVMSSAFVSAHELHQFLY